MALRCQAVYDHGDFRRRVDALLPTDINHLLVFRGVAPLIDECSERVRGASVWRPRNEGFSLAAQDSASEKRAPLTDRLDISVLSARSRPCIIIGLARHPDLRDISCAGSNDEPPGYGAPDSLPVGTRAEL